MAELSLPRYLAGCIKNTLGLSDEEEEIAVYSLETIIYGCLNILLVCFIGWLLKCFLATLIILIVGMLLRSFSGGAHSSSPYICILISTIVIPLLGMGVVQSAPCLSYSWLVLLTSSGFFISLTAVMRLAPLESTQKPFNSPRHRRQLRLLSITFVLLAAAVQFYLLLLTHYFWTETAILAIEAGLLWQTFTLTKTGHNFVTAIDKIFY